MKKIIVLGAGLVGAPMALDLAADSNFRVTVADISKDALARFRGNTNITTICSDLSKKENIVALVKDQDLVLSAVPGHLGFQTLQTVIEAGKNVIDIAFFAEDMFELDALAREKNVVAISDMGVAPGMSNVLIGYVDHLLDTTSRAVIYVGGLPQVRTLPYEYKAVFSPIDVIEEYTRPARFVSDGKLVTRPALTDAELMEFPEVGTLEAFNSDGLRSLAKTINCPEMIEKTLRYPGHIDKMLLLRDTGFFDTTPVEINGQSIRPIDLTCKLLFPIWKLKPGDADLTVMRIIVEGTKAGKRIRYTYDLLDKYDPKSGVHSMARTTGYAATMAVRLIAENLYTNIGVSAPEFIGKESDCVDFMLEGLARRGVIYEQSIERF
jgi:saccharopine dehydrogenase-like NADP-dependent oxidoreductase